MKRDSNRLTDIIDRAARRQTLADFQLKLVVDTVSEGMLPDERERIAKACKLAYWRGVGDGMQAQLDAEKAARERSGGTE